MSLDWLSNAQKKDSTELSPLSANAAFLLNKGSKKKKSEEMKLYLLQKQAALRIYISASSLAPTSVVRRSLRQCHQAQLSSSMPY